jgi:hypothetical protein
MRLQAKDVFSQPVHWTSRWQLSDVFILLGSKTWSIRSIEATKTKFLLHCQELKSQCYASPKLVMLVRYLGESHATLEKTNERNRETNWRWILGWKKKKTINNNLASEYRGGTGSSAAKALASLSLLWPWVRFPNAFVFFPRCVRVRKRRDLRKIKNK